MPTTLSKPRQIVLPNAGGKEPLTLVGGTARSDVSRIWNDTPHANFNLDGVKSIRELYQQEENALNKFLLELLRIQKELKRTNASVSPELRTLVAEEQDRWHAFDEKAIALLEASNAQDRELAEQLKNALNGTGPTRNVTTFVRVLFTPLKPRKILEPVGTIGDFIQHQKTQRIAAMRARRRQR